MEVKYYVVSSDANKFIPLDFFKIENNDKQQIITSVPLDHLKRITEMGNRPENLSESEFISLVENVSIRLGLLLRQERRKQNKTLREVADLCNITSSYLSKIENGTRDFQVSSIQAAATALGLSLGFKAKKREV